MRSERASSEGVSGPSAVPSRRGPHLVGRSAAQRFRQGCRDREQSRARILRLRIGLLLGIGALGLALAALGSPFGWFVAAGSGAAALGMALLWFLS